MTSDNLKSTLILAGVLVGVAMLWKVKKKGDDLFKAVGQTVDQAAATVQSSYRNNIATPWQRGTDFMNGVEPVVSSKAWLYSDYQYTGIDPATGQLITDGEWYSDEEARRYDAEQRASGSAPAATSNNGAAFGVYPQAPKKKADNYNFGVSGKDWN